MGEVNSVPTPLLSCVGSAFLREESFFLYKVSAAEKSKVIHVNTKEARGQIPAGHRVPATDVGMVWNFIFTLTNCARDVKYDLSQYSTIPFTYKRVDTLDNRMSWPRVSKAADRSSRKKYTRIVLINIPI